MVPVCWANLRSPGYCHIFCLANCSGAKSPSRDERKRVTHYKEYHTINDPESPCFARSALNGDAAISPRHPSPPCWCWMQLRTNTYIELVCSESYDAQNVGPAVSDSIFHSRQHLLASSPLQFLESLKSHIRYFWLASDMRHGPARHHG